VFAANLMSALEPDNKVALALSCSAMRQAVHRSASMLTLRKGSSCYSRSHQLAQTLPSIRQVLLKPGNMHEALCVLPMFFMQVRRLVDDGLSCMQAPSTLAATLHHGRPIAC
jgi:hypothetical protein